MLMYSTVSTRWVLFRPVSRRVQGVQYTRAPLARGPLKIKLFNDFDKFKSRY